MIDLHTHTTESDGTLTPAELVTAAIETGLEALAIADHDTLAGYDQAVAPAARAGLELVCAVEVSTRLRRPDGGSGESVHLLGYFLMGPPGDEFRRWLERQVQSRCARNARLAARLRELGMEVTLEEVTARAGRLTGRPHFARTLVEKGYVASEREAFRLYLGQAGKAYVARDSVAVSEGIEQICQAGGLPCLAHPGRLRTDVEGLIALLRGQGLGALEAYSSEHTPAQTDLYLSLARRYELAITGGSDFHGDTKPGVRLGSGADGNLAVPRAILERLREVAVLGR